ncbi:MAG: transcription antitermination factor NusB [Bacilli bacterium]|nr:transcription antitermination factor NusB [Bacilli bacterium]
MNRTELRKIIMTILYQVFLYESSNIEYDLEEVIKENIEIDNDFVNDIVKGVLENRNDIDKIANKNLKDWTIDRLGKIDQAILRMGIYELVYTDTPEVVAINEAVELAKEYSDEKVKNMINAVLDKIYHGDNKDEQ